MSKSPESSDDSQAFSSADLMILKMMAGCTGTEQGRIILPSGREINGAQAQSIVAELTGVEPVVHDHAPVRTTEASTTANAYRETSDGHDTTAYESPLSSHHDNWTRDPELDRVMLVARAFDALYQSQNP